MKHLPADSVETRAKLEALTELHRRNCRMAMAATITFDQTGLIPVRVMTISNRSTGAHLATIRVTPPSAKADENGVLPPAYSITYQDGAA